MAKLIRVPYNQATTEQLATYRGHPSNAPKPGEILLFTAAGEYYGTEVGSVMSDGRFLAKGE